MKRDAELWIARTMWEKRRQLSGALHRSLLSPGTTLVMSCDEYATFFGRVDMTLEQSLEATASGALEYIQVMPLLGTSDSTGIDLSRVIGPLGAKLNFGANDYARVLVDDVDLIVDLRSEEAAVASMFTLLYALRARFREIVLFSNPVRSEVELAYFGSMRDFLSVRGGPAPEAGQNVA